MKIKIFKDYLGTNQFRDTKLFHAEDQLQEWIEKENPEIIDISHQSSAGEYTWISGNSRGEFDHEKRTHVFISILVKYK